MGFLTEKVKEKPDPNSKTAIDFDSKVTAERDKQIKVIVLNAIIIYTVIIISCKNQIVVKILKIKWWTESHLLRLYFGVFQPLKSTMVQ